MRGVSCKPSQKAHAAELPTASKMRTDWTVREDFKRVLKSRSSGADYAPRGLIVQEFLRDYCASDWHGIDGALGANKRGVLYRARRHKSHKVAKPTRRDHGDLVVKTETGGLHSERAAPARKYDCFGFSMVWPGCESVGDALRICLQMAASNAQRRAVAQHKNVWTYRGLAMPIDVRRGIFSGRVFGSRRLPFAKFFAEPGHTIGKRSTRSMNSPKLRKALASVFATLDRLPIWNGATLGPGHATSETQPKLYDMTQMSYPLPLSLPLPLPQHIRGNMVVQRPYKWQRLQYNKTKRHVIGRG